MIHWIFILLFLGIIGGGIAAALILTKKKDDDDNGNDDNGNDDNGNDNGNDDNGSADSDDFINIKFYSIKTTEPWISVEEGTLLDDALLEAILGCSDCKGFNLQLDSDENPIRYQYIKEDNNNLCEGSVTLDRINNLYIKREYVTQNGKCEEDPIEYTSDYIGVPIGNNARLIPQNNLFTTSYSNESELDEKDCQNKCSEDDLCVAYNLLKNGEMQEKESNCELIKSVNPFFTLAPSGEDRGLKWQENENSSWKSKTLYNLFGNGQITTN